MKTSDATEVAVARASMLLEMAGLTLHDRQPGRWATPLFNPLLFLQGLDRCGAYFWAMIGEEEGGFRGLMPYVGHTDLYEDPISAAQLLVLLYALDLGKIMGTNMDSDPDVSLEKLLKNSQRRS